MRLTEFFFFPTTRHVFKVRLDLRPVQAGLSLIGWMRSSLDPEQVKTDTKNE